MLGSYQAAALHRLPDISIGGFTAVSLDRGMPFPPKINVSEEPLWLW